MRKIVLAAAAALCLASCSPKSYFFVQMTDPQMGFKENGTIERSVEYLHETVDAINRLHPAFVVVTGDMLNNWNHDDQWEAYHTIMADIDKDIPVWHIPGNHDYRPLKEVESVSTYFERFGYDRFCFMYKGSLYLGFNTNVIKDGQTRLEEAQYDWMVENLERYAPKAKHIFLFGHCSIIREKVDEPVNYFNFQEPYRTKYLELCKKYGVDAAMFGHFHRTRLVKYEDTQHITLSACGETLGDGVRSINLVTVTPEGWSFDIVAPAEAQNPLKK